MTDATYRGPFEQELGTAPPPQTVEPGPFEKAVVLQSKIQSGVRAVASSVPSGPSWLPAAIGDIPKEIASSAGENFSAINTALNPFSQDYKNAHKTPQSLGEVIPQSAQDLKTTTQGLAAIPGLVLSPLTGTVKSVVGHTLADSLHMLNPSETKFSEVQPDLNKPSNLLPALNPQQDPVQTYQTGKGMADTAMSLVAPKGGVAPRSVGVAPTPVPDVILSKGQQTGDLNFIKPEQKAAAGDLGPAAQQRAIQFKAQQDTQVQNANDVVAKSFDQFNQNIAQNPQEAGALAQQGLQQAKTAEKTAVSNKYAAARSMGGEVDAGAVQNMGDSIRNNLTSRPDPVIIDEKLTPWASQAINEVDKAASFNIPNKADPAGAPDPNQVQGVSLEGLDQVRKRLSEFRRGAWANNASDGRAASAVVDAFDDHIDQAVNSGAFRGNPDAVAAWNEARASSAAFKQKFAANKGNPVSQQIDKIIGPRGGEPLTPNDVADALYGGSGTNPGSKNVGVAVKTRNILGADSPEWSAVKQGLWSRLTERGTGQNEMGPGMIANRISKFLNSDGKEMANAVYSPAERQAIGKYADLMRSLEVPKGAVMTAASAPIVAPILRRISSGISYVMGYALAHHLGFGAETDLAAGYAAGKGSEILNSWRNGRQIAKQMPLVTEATQKFQNALAAYNKANSPPSRVALSVATTNLARQLKPLGISFDGLFPTGAQPATADQQQQ